MDSPGILRSSPVVSPSAVPVVHRDVMMVSPVTILILAINRGLVTSRPKWPRAAMLTYISSNTIIKQVLKSVLL